MRAAMYVMLPLLLICLYSVDQFQFDGEYRRLAWKEVNAQAQVLQDELKTLFHR